MKYLYKVEEYFLTGLFIFALFALTAQVLSRYIFPYPLPWTEELSRFLFLWIVLFGSAYTMRVGGLIAVNVIVDRLPTGFRKFFALTMNILILIFLLVIAWFGFILMFKVSSLPTIAMGISSSWEYGALPLAAIAMAMRTISQIYHIARYGLPKSSSEVLI